MTAHLNTAQLEAGLAHILASPKDGGRLEAIVSRPGHGERLDLSTAWISLAGGVEGDHWAKGCWKTTPEGKPDPDVQICIMNARCIALVAGERSNWPPAGDNLFVDMDLSFDNLPAGTRLELGGALLEITAVPHLGCNSFIERYGRDACVFVNTGEGRKNRLRGVYARVMRDGQIAVGDVLRKVR
ncbi:MAG: hypothetical protein U1E46_12035 [Hyphomicrobiales bacterium]